MDDIYYRTPVNKTASLVTSQSGCEDELDSEKERENLSRKARRLQEEIVKLPKKSEERRLLGQQLEETNRKINSIRPKLRGRPVGKLTVADVVVEILREEFSNFEFRKLIHKASKRLDGYRAHYNDETNHH